MKKEDYDRLHANFKEYKKYGGKLGFKKWQKLSFSERNFWMTGNDKTATEVANEK